MATKLNDQRIVTVEVSQVELNQLLVERAKAAGMIDFDPTKIQVHESDAALGTYHIIFENQVEITPA